MPSRAYTSFLPDIGLSQWNQRPSMCQCPLGLIPHFYESWCEVKRRTKGVCQCPLGLIPHFYSIWGLWDSCHRVYVSMPSRAYTSFLPTFDFINKAEYVYDVSMPSRAYTSFLPRRPDIPVLTLMACVNALSGLYLISTVPLQKPRFYAVSRACFCRYLSEYSDNSRFSCMLTFWTYLMRCTYPWHWIKYSTNYNRCHPIFSLSW